MSSQIFCGMDLNRANFDLKFTETISQSMQIPSRLKMSYGPISDVDGTAVDDSPPSFQMHIPERISLAGVEMMEIGLRPFQLDQLHQKPSVFTYASLGNSSTSTEFPFLKATTRPVSSNSKRLTSQSRSQKAQTCSENTSPATHGAINRLDGTQDVEPNTEIIVEDLGMMEIIAMRKLLINVSGRLQSLEEERAGSYQKEVLIYTALLTACLINTWLWLRR